MKGLPPLKLNTTIQSRSASGVSDISSDQTKTSSSKEKSSISKFLTKVGKFFKNIFGYGKKNVTQIDTHKSSPQIKIKKPVIYTKTTVEKKVDPRMQKLDFLKQSINKLDIPKLKGNSQIQSLKQDYASLDIKTISLDQINAFQNKINQSIASFTKVNVTKNKKVVDESITRFVKYTHTKFQEKMAPIQQTVKQRINTMQAKRDMKTEFKKDLNIRDNEQADNLYQKLLDLYTEKELKSTFTTSMGTVYDHLDPTKQDLGWGGRSDMEIDHDINTLLNSDSQLKVKYDNKIGDLFKGISNLMNAETTTLIDSVQQNDTVMANIKAVQLSLSSIDSTEEGIESTLADVQDQAALTNIDKLLEINTIADNMAVFSKAYIEGFHDQTHVEAHNIKDKVIELTQENTTFNTLPDSKKEEFVNDLTQYLSTRYEDKGIIQSSEKEHYSVDTKSRDNFKLRSKKDSIKKSWPKLFNSKESTGMFSSRTIEGEFSQRFSTIESSLEQKITSRTGTLKKEELHELISQACDESGIEKKDEFINYLRDYTMDRLEEKHVVSYADSGTILKADKEINIQSKKKTFTQSQLQQNPEFKKIFSEIKTDLGKEMKNMVKSADTSRGLTSKVELMTKKLIQAKSKSYVSKTSTNIKMSARLTFNKIKTASNPITELRSTIDNIKDTVNNFEESLTTNNSQQLSAKQTVDDKVISHLDTAQEQIQNTQTQLTGVTEQLKNTSAKLDNVQSPQDEKKASEFEKLSSKLLNESGITDVATTILNGITPSEDQLAQLKEKSTQVLTVIDQMKSLVGENADKADMLIEQIPYAGQIYSAAKLLSHISKAHNKSEEITKLRTMISTVNSDNIEKLFTDEDTRTDSFSNLLKQKDERSEIFADVVFSAINIATAPLGVSVGSALKQAYNLNKAGSLTDSDYKQISKNIMTLNNKYHNMSTHSKEATTHEFIGHLKDGNIEKKWDQISDSFINYSLAGVDSNVVKQEILA